MLPAGVTIWVDYLLTIVPLVSASGGCMIFLDKVKTVRTSSGSFKRAHSYNYGSYKNGVCNKSVSKE